MSAAGAKAVVMTWWRRPRYSRLVAEALCRCYGVEDYQVIVHVEPDSDEVVRLAHEFPLPNKRVVVHPERYGCSRSIHAAMRDGFAVADYVVLLEDDVVPAPDALLFFEWCRRRYAGDHSVLSAAAYNKGPLVADPSAVFRAPWFHPWGWATWADRWAELDALWQFCDPRGWDGAITHGHRGDRVEVRPRLSRTQNIGAELGTHCPGPDAHAAAEYNAVWAGDTHGPPVADYREETGAAGCCNALP